MTGSSLRSSRSTRGLLRLPKSNTPTCRTQQQDMGQPVGWQLHCILWSKHRVHKVFHRSATDAMHVLYRVYAEFMNQRTCCLYVSPYSPSANRCAALLFFWYRITGRRRRARKSAERPCTRRSMHSNLEQQENKKTHVTA